MRRVMAVAGAVTVAGLLMVGCGSSDSGSSAESTTTTSEPAQLSQAELQAGLLTAADLGTGWVVDPPSPDSSGGKPSCLQDVDSGAGETSKAESQFTMGEDTFFGEELVSAGGEADANFDKAKAALDGCTDLSFTSNGTRLTGEIKPLDGFEAVGDDSAAYSMVLTGNGVTVDFDAAIVRVGGVEMTVLYGGLNTPDLAEFQQLVTAAVDKVDQGGLAA